MCEQSFFPFCTFFISGAASTTAEGPIFITFFFWQGFRPLGNEKEEEKTVEVERRQGTENVTTHHLLTVVKTVLVLARKQLTVILTHVQVICHHIFIFGCEMVKTS